MNDENTEHNEDDLQDPIPDEQPKRDHLLSNGTYNKLKPVAQVWLPALATLYFAISTTWGLPFGPEVVATITAFDTFLGLVLVKASASYSSSETKYDGSVNVQQTEDGLQPVRVVMNTDTVNSSELIMKVEDVTPTF